MKKFFRRVFRLFLICVLVSLFTVMLNNETDIISDFGKYSPQTLEKYPQVCEALKSFSDYLSVKTGHWPTVSRIIAAIEKSSINPQELVTNSYIKNSPMVSFYEPESIGFSVNKNAVTIFGNSENADNNNFIAIFTDDKNNEILQTSFSKNFQNEFAEKITIPKTDKSRLEISVYTSPKMYGEYNSMILDYVYIVKNDIGEWEIEKSPVYENNCEFYETEKPVNNALTSSSAILSEREDVKRFVNNIVNGIDNDYDKLLALHDWICKNIYYDEDAVQSGEYPSYNPIDVINSRKGVCKGFAYLFATMVRSINIPCNIVSGYALGVEEIDDWGDVSSSEAPNHAWNEAYVDGRWIIIDTTWDCGNKIENGNKTELPVSHVYFDANIDYFSANHKIMEYITR